MLLIYQSSIVSQILDFIHWTVTIFSFDHMTGENRELIELKLCLPWSEPCNKSLSSETQDKHLATKPNNETEKKNFFIIPHLNTRFWKGILGISDLNKIRCGNRENDKYLDGIRDLTATREAGLIKI